MNYAPDKRVEHSVKRLAKMRLRGFPNREGRGQRTIVPFAGLMFQFPLSFLFLQLIPTITSPYHDE
jgi:hypothetical protein